METHWKKMVAHAVADIFPMMCEEAYVALKNDIEKHGLIEPIWLHEGRIIDGRNRHRACCELNREPDTRDWDGNGSLVEFVWSLNGERRHMTAGQLAAVATEMLPMLEAEAKERQRKAGGDRKSDAAKSVPEFVPEPIDHSGDARDKAAATVGVNPRYVSDAKKLKEESPILFEQVKSGEITLPAARRQLEEPKPADSKPQTKDRFSEVIDELYKLTRSPSLAAPYSEIKRLVVELRDLYRRTNRN